MHVLDKPVLVAHILRWRAGWERHDSHYRPAGLPARFVSARDAVALIPEAACVISCGFAGNARCSTFFWALRERYAETAAPAGLTWISVGAQGGRGRVPGTVEEVALEGLVTRYVSGHTETAKAILKLADAGVLELHTLPQGEMTHLIEAQGRGDREVRSRTGVGTFLDPRVGTGSAVSPGARSQLVRMDGEELVYCLPRIDVALFNAPYADHDGNVYFTHAATISENVEAARAARANGGLAMAAVSAIVERDEGAIGLRAAEVDAIVVNRRNEQTGSVPQRRYWRMFTAGAQVDTLRAVANLRFLNRTLGITPRRDDRDHAMARLAARTFTSKVPAGATVNVGVGLAEEVCHVLCECGVHDQVTFTTESGPWGGLPAPGIFFGAAINPQRLESSAWMFHHYREHLDAALLGFLQVDEAGNVNLSRRGPRMQDYVGPGGAPSIVAAAKTVLFVGKWMEGAQVRIDGDRLRLERPGKPKFIAAVDEVSINGIVNLREGKRIFCVTDLCVIEITDSGLVLRAVMPGIDIDRDLLAHCSARIEIPADVETVPAAVVTGDGFALQWAAA